MHLRWVIGPSVEDVDKLVICNKTPIAQQQPPGLLILGWGGVLQKIRELEVQNQGLPDCVFPVLCIYKISIQR